MKLKVWIALVLVYIIWGATYLGIRFAVETIPPFLMAGTRFLVAGAIFYIWRRSAGDPAPTRGQWLRAGLVGLILLLGGNGLISLAEKNVASGIAALIVGSAPLWMTTIEALRPSGVRPNCIGRDRTIARIRRDRSAGRPIPSPVHAGEFPANRDHHCPFRGIILVDRFGHGPKR